MKTTSQATASSTDAEWMRILIDKVNSVRFGVIQLIIHEGKVTQIECTEKTRLESQGKTSRRDD